MEGGVLLKNSLHYVFPATATGTATAAAAA
jgi:hypothetical protein